MKPIRTETEYQAALAEIETLWQAEDGSNEADHLEVLVLLVEDYERKNHPIPDPDPIDFLTHVMEARGLTRKDLEPYIGHRGRVAEILGRVRPLSLDMIRRLADGLGLPADVLVKRYDLRTAA